MHSAQQICDAFAAPRRHWHHRNAQITRQPAVIHLQLVAARLIHQVQAEHGTVGYLQHLQHQVQVAFQTRGIHNHHRHIRLPEQNKIARHLLIQGGGEQRIGAGKINNLVALLAV